MSNMQIRAYEVWTHFQSLGYIGEHEFPQAVKGNILIKFRFVD
jgi:hypothetical protein